MRDLWTVKPPPTTSRVLPAETGHGQVAVALQRGLFRLWRRFRGDPDVRGVPITHQKLIVKALPVEKKFFALAERYVNAADADMRNPTHALFVHAEGVEPTNNIAERALRTAVAEDHVRQSQ